MSMARGRWYLALTVVVAAPAAGAFDLRDWRLRGGAEFAEMVSSPQRTWGFNHGLHLRGAASVQLTPQLEVQVGWSYWNFPRAQPSGAGAMFGPFGSLRANLFTPDNMTFSAEVSVGPQVTGGDLGVGGDLGISFEYRVSSWLMLGVTARGGATFSTIDLETAYYCSLGVNASLQLPLADTDRDGVVDSRDLCLTNPRGEIEDPQRPGCPLDTDGDGEADQRDLCPTEHDGGAAAGSRERPGCPGSAPGSSAPLGEQSMISSSPRVDSVVISANPLLTAPDVVPRPDPSSTTLPSSTGRPDQDQDGYGDQQDRCPDLPESFNGVGDDDGCPDGRELARVDGDTVRLGVPIRFQNRGLNEHDRDTVSVLQALAALLRAHCAPHATIEVFPDAGDAGQAIADARGVSLVNHLRRITPSGVSPGCSGELPVQYVFARPSDAGDGHSVRVRLR